MYNKKWAHPGVFIIFPFFQTHITNLTTNRYVTKCPSSTRFWDSNSRPLEHESIPITTRPGLSPTIVYNGYLNRKYSKHTNQIRHGLQKHRADHLDDTFRPREPLPGRRRRKRSSRPWRTKPDIRRIRCTRRPYLNR